MIASPSVKFRSAAAGRTNGTISPAWPLRPMVPTPGSSPSQFATRIIRKRPTTSETYPRQREVELATMPVSSSIGSSMRLCSRFGTIADDLLKYQAAASRITEAMSAPIMLFVTSNGPMLNSRSALSATWISFAFSAVTYLLIAFRATSQIVYIAAPIPSAIPIRVKIGLVRSQLSSSRPPPTPRATDIPSRSPRSKAIPRFATRGLWGGLPSGSIAGPAIGVAPAHAGADEEPDADGRDQGSDRQTGQHKERAAGQHPVEDEAGHRASNDRDHHDQGHQAQDLDEPDRRQLCHSVRLTAVGRREYSGGHPRWRSGLRPARRSGRACSAGRAPGIGRRCLPPVRGSAPARRGRCGPRSRPR